MGFLVGVFRFLLLLLLVRFVMRTIAALLRPALGSASAGRTAVHPGSAAGAKALAQPLVRDRICNTFLPPDRALTGVVEGQTEFFCSAACRDQALVAKAS